MTVPGFRRRFVRPLAWGLALCLCAVSLAYTALWLYYRDPSPETLSAELGLPRDQVLEPAVKLGFNVEYGEGARGVSVGPVTQGGAAERAGLRAGDLIVAVNGRSLAVSAGPFLAAYRAARPGDPVEFTVARPGEARPIVLRVAFASRPWLERIVPVLRLVNRTMLLFPILFLAVALPVLFLRIGDPHAWRLAALFVCLAAAPAVPFDLQAPSTSGVGFVMAYKGATSALLALFFYLFFAAFPERSPVDRRVPGLKWVLVGMGLLFAAGGVVVGRRGHPWLPHPLAVALGDRATSALWHAYNYGGIAAGLVALVTSAVSNPRPDARRKIGVIVRGTLVGIAPIVLISVLSDLDVWHAPAGLTSVAGVLVFLFPLAFAYAVVKHRVLELPVLLKRSARYVFVKRGFAVLLVLLAATANLFFAAAFTRLFRVEASSATAAGVGFGILLAAASAPAVRRTTRLIDRSFFRDAYDVRLVLQELAEKIRTVTRRADLGALLRRQLDQALHPSSVVVYLGTGDGRLHTDDTSMPPGLRDLAADTPEFAHLARRGAPRDVGPDDDSILSALHPEILVPILGREGRLLGLAVLGPRLSEEPYSADDERLLGTVASQAGVTLENMALAERMAERLEAEHRAAHEIELARQVQAKLLPQAGPRLRALEYGGRCVQARAVGGDYYDFLDAGEGKVGLVLADVSGKGLAAALLMASLHASLRSQSRDADLSSQLRTVNRLLYGATETNRYATLFFGRFDEEGRRLRYVNCGHNPPLVLRRDGAQERLLPTAMVVGLVEGWDCETAEVSLAKGDVLAIYSDGITEATNRAGEEFGEARLARALRDGHSQDVRALLDTVFDEVRAFSEGEQADDQTMVIARVLQP
jgi:sigma-B regulation protein RsbU (phosphoserine phosphatase)